MDSDPKCVVPGILAPLPYQMIQTPGFDDIRERLAQPFRPPWRRPLPRVARR